MSASFQTPSLAAGSSIVSSSGTACHGGHRVFTQRRSNRGLAPIAEGGQRRGDRHGISAGIARDQRQASHRARSGAVSAVACRLAPRLPARSPRQRIAVAMRRLCSSALPGSDAGWWRIASIHCSVDADAIQQDVDGRADRGGRLARARWRLCERVPSALSAAWSDAIGAFEREQADRSLQRVDGAEGAVDKMRSLAGSRLQRQQDRSDACCEQLARFRSGTVRAISSITGSAD